MRILIDMDGVCADFISGLLKLYGCDPIHTEKKKYSFDCFPYLNQCEQDFWKEHATKDFWAKLDKTPECDEIINTCVGLVGIKNVAICTSPPWSPWARAQAVEGKSEWIMEHFPAIKKNVIFTSTKYFCASKDTILIDDADHNQEKFVAAGGNCLLLPRPWNHNYELDTLEYFRNYMSNIELIMRATH